MDKSGKSRTGNGLNKLARIHIIVAILMIISLYMGWCSKNVDMKGLLFGQCMIDCSSFRQSWSEQVGFFDVPFRKYSSIILSMDELCVGYKFIGFQDTVLDGMQYVSLATFYEDHVFLMILVS